MEKVWRKNYYIKSMWRIWGNKYKKNKKTFLEKNLKFTKENGGKDTLSPYLSLHFRTFLKKY